MAAKVTRAERYRQAKALRDEGLLVREIAERMGVGRSAVSNLLNDPDNSAGRARNRRWAARPENRVECQDCGALCCPGSRHLGVARCRPCSYLSQRTVDHAERLAFVEWLYKEGYSIRAIGRELGYGPRSSPSVILDELRKAGRIGYRWGFEWRAGA